MPSIPRAVCLKCLVPMKPHHNGLDIEMLIEDGRPYYKISADGYKCPDCGVEIAVGFAYQPYAIVWQGDYAETRPADIQVALEPQGPRQAERQEADVPRTVTQCLDAAYAAIVNGESTVAEEAILEAGQRLMEIRNHVRAIQSRAEFTPKLISGTCDCGYCWGNRCLAIIGEEAGVALESRRFIAWIESKEVTP